MVARTVWQYAKAGIAGEYMRTRFLDISTHMLLFIAMHIEDQVQTKRCGHLLGKQVVSREEFVMRIRAAVIARDSIPGGSDFVSTTIISSPCGRCYNCDPQVIIGRTDSAQVLGMDEAVYRLKLAAAAGADVCFIEGVRTKELLEKTVAELAPKPVLVNVISGGLTPSFTTNEAEQMGAKIISAYLLCHPPPRSHRLTGARVLVFSLVSCVAAYHGIRDAMHLLKKTGTDFTSARGMDPKAFFAVMGLDEVVNLDARAGGTAFQVV